MNKILILAIILANCNRTEAQVFTLESATEFALRHNYDYQKSQLDRAIMYEKCNEVLSMGFPKVNGAVAYQNQFEVQTSVMPGEAFGQPGKLLPVKFGVSNVMNASVGVQQLIFDGRYLVGVQARSALKSMSQLQVRMSERDVKNLIAKSYYQASVAQKSIASINESRKVLADLLDQTRKIYKQGLIEELDVERLEYNLKTLNLTAEAVENQAELAALALKLNMGYPIDSPILINQDFVNSISEIRSQKYELEDVSNRVELLMIENSKKIKQYDIKQMRFGYLPSVYGAFNYGYNSFSRQFNFTETEWYPYGNFGIQLSVPIFDGFTRKYQVSQAKMELEKLDIEKQKVTNALRLDLKNNMLSLKHNLEEYDNQKEILTLSEKIEKKTQVKYKEGVGSSFEFANAQNERIQQYLKLLQTELKLLTSYVDYQKAIGQ